MDKTFLTKEELDELKLMQDQNKFLANAFGELEINSQILKSQKEILVNNLNELRNKQQVLSESLQKKYGEGTISIESGEFTPSEK
jgi:hypothetical protein